MLIAVLGAALLVAVIWLLGRLGAPTWLRVMPWSIPTLAVVTWVVVRPRPAIPTDSDDDSWTGYAIQYGLVGEVDARPLPQRLVAAAVFGGAVAWSLLVIGVGAIVGMSG